MSDSARSAMQLDATWRSFGAALSAAAGAASALLSLLADVPLSTACLRGALALCAVQVVVRLAAAALARTSPAPMEQRKTSDEPSTAGADTATEVTRG